MKKEIFSFPKHHLELTTIAPDDKTYIEITLRNLKFNQSRFKLLQLILVLLFIYLIILYLFQKPANYAIHISFIITVIGCIYYLINIVEKEVVKVLNGFGLQYSTHYMLSRSKSNFIPINNIYQVVINEVIYLNKVIYVLQVLTDKECFEQMPIVVLFDNILPPLDCLKMVYNKMSPMMKRR